ncbi:hypothetical protein GQ457_15G015690 [Hibiscus cannabinus]
MATSFSACVTLNTDGTVNLANSHGITREIFRDHIGGWLVGFHKYLDMSQPLQAELWGILEGLRIAWNCNFERVCCQIDCTEAHKLVSSKSAHCSPISIVRAIHAMIVKA